MRTVVRRVCWGIVMSLVAITISAQNEVVTIINEATDTITSIAADTIVSVEEPKKKTLLARFVEQLLNGNKDRTFEQAIDIGVAIIPSYSREASVGLGAMLTGLYRIDRTDSLMPPSDVQFFANASLKGQYSIILKGNNLFKGNRSRLSYDLAFQNKPLDFWGISYAACDVNTKSHYTKQQIKLESDYVYKLTPKFHVGAALNVRYTYLSEIGDVSYLEGQETSYFFTGLGISLCYDSRDFIPNPKRGFYIMLKEIIYPAPFGTGGRNIFSTTFIADYYQPLWKGCIAAIDLYGQYNGTDVPWPLRPEIGSGGMRMRGYYSGRYIDNNILCGQIELRQHLYKRWGVVAWVGCGTVFPSFEALRASHLLLNYGIGVRFEFKHHVNLRIDYGWGESQGALIFNIAEAF